jgi:dimethylaniline monooxygenase (N-oxide forming)
LENENENISTVMFSTVANSSKEMSSFSDFPPQQSIANYMHNKYMLSYIESYAKHFDCLRHFRYKHEVILIEKTSTNKWRIVLKAHKRQVERESEPNTTETTEEIFDAVMICTGHHSYPNIPTFTDQHRFKGEFIHTHKFKKPDKYYGKKALVIGVGNSGIDVAVELSGICEKVGTIF